MQNHKYIQAEGELFEAVQKAHLFPDQKTFPDSVPLGDPEIIEAKYQKLKNSKEFNLMEFVKTHFMLPEYARSDTLTTSKGKFVPIEDYIENSWTILTRLSLTSSPYDTAIQLPSPYVVPGGRFREMYYWDSFFTALGIIHHKRYDLLYGICNNYAYFIKKLGYIPNASRTYFYGRSQPPTFALLVHLLSRTRKADVYNDYLDVLETEYRFWMDGEKELAEGEAYRRVVNCKGYILNRYFDDTAKARAEAWSIDLEVAAKNNNRESRDIFRDINSATESGWDFSGRWFKKHNKIESIQTTSVIPVDLNCLLYIYERKFAFWYHHKGNEQKSRIYRIRAANRKRAIQEVLFNTQRGFYTDYIIGGGPSDYLTLAGAYPLYAQIPNLTQARQVISLLENKFLYPGGLVTSLTETKEQWDYPNGWAPLQWIVVQGLENYYQEELAATIRLRWNTLVNQTYQNTGLIFEKYNVVEPSDSPQDGEYALQAGFGWTNGVYMDFLKSGYYL